MYNANKVHQITRMAILTAIIFLLSFTPLGYLTIGWASARVAKGSAPGMVSTLMMALRPKKKPSTAPETARKPDGHNGFAPL